MNLCQVILLHEYDPCCSDVDYIVNMYNALLFSVEDYVG